MAGLDESDRLKDQVESGSKDKRRLVYNSAINLCSRGKLRKDESGRLFVNNGTAAD